MLQDQPNKDTSLTLLIIQAIFVLIELGVASWVFYWAFDIPNWSPKIVIGICIFMWFCYTIHDLIKNA